MGIRVSDNQVQVGLARVIPRVTVAAVHPVVRVGYVAPVSALTYIALAIDAFLDTSRKYNLFTDQIKIEDHGFAVSQDYCHPSYFAEDYVGVSVHF